jgi:trimeric autotransporter adhesin
MKTPDLRSFKSVLIVATLLLALSPSGLTQNTANSPAVTVPHLMKFSGVVKDEAGAPKTGIVGVTFAFYKDQQGGAPLWLETQNVQADANGRYTAMLGATKPDGLRMEFFSSNEARWVGVQPQGQNEQPRVLLVSAPYALKASDAETLGGRPASAYVLSTPGTGSTTTSRTGASDASVNNSITPPIGGTGTPNHIAKWKTNTILENSGIIEGSAGNVGIGSAPSNFRLQVTAPNQLGTVVQGPFSGVGAGLQMQTTGTGGKGWEILATGKSAAQGPNKLNIRDLSTGTDVFTIAPGGLVGIGQVTPGTILQVTDKNNANIGAVIAGDMSSSNAAASAVFGDATATTGTTRGVFGQIFSSSAGAAAVEGEAQAASGQTYGVQGYNFGNGNFSAGVSAVSSPGSGITFGAIALSNSPNGTGTMGVGQGNSKTGNSFIGCCSFGVWGDTSSSVFSASGLIGTADNARAIYLQNNSTQDPTAFMFNSASGQFALQAGGGGGFCTIDTTGHLHCDNALSVLAPVDRGQRRVALYAVESPQNWFEDFGSGQLASGTARVTLDHTFAEAANADVRYHVFLTPRDECEGLYVSNATASGFEVHELHHGNSSAAFDYRIVALRRGYENVRLEDMTERLNKLNTPQPKATPGQRMMLPGMPPLLNPSAPVPSKRDVATVSTQK